MVAGERVADDELLYRRVEYQGQGYKLCPGARPRISSQAFADRKLQPSFDRAVMIVGPEVTQGSADNGVVRLSTANIREINAVDQKAKAQPAPVPQTEPATAKKLTYGERIELAGLMEQIDAAEAEVSRPEADLASESFAGLDYREQAAHLEQLAAARSRAEALVERWGELEARSELT